MTLVFVIPIAFAVLLGAGALMGLVGDVDAPFDIDIDVDLDVDADMDGDAEGAGHGVTATLLSVLGVGRAPLSILLSAALMSFGVTGLSANLLLPEWAALLIASCVAPLSTSVVSRLFGRFAPPVESYVLRRDQFVGATGEARLNVDSESGLAVIRDRRGTLHQIYCRVDEGCIRKGEPLVVIDFDEVTKLHTVASFMDSGA